VCTQFREQGTSAHWLDQRHLDFGSSPTVAVRLSDALHLERKGGLEGRLQERTF
jgi:hypothetical protein